MSPISPPRDQRGRSTAVALLLMSALLSIATPLANVSAQAAASTQSHGLDWKFYGIGEFEGAGVVLLYDAQSIVTRLDGDIEVWTKIFSIKSITDETATEDKTKRDERRQRELQAVRDGKVPYIVVIGHEPSSSKTLGVQDGMMLASFQDVADTGEIEPVAKVLYELDCQDRKYRALSTLLSDGTSSHEPAPWRHVSPESQGADLLKMVCPHR